MNHSTIRVLFAIIFLILIATGQHACVVAPPPGGTGGPGGPPPQFNHEPNVDRPGMNYHHFNLHDADPGLCENACAKDPNCRAFTYVRPGIQGPKARCWLKHSVPPAKSSGCCISGVKGAVPGGPLPGKPSIEPNVNRPGMDYTSFDLNKPRPKRCRNACAKDPKCRAYTYVKPGVQGPKARCWLKHGVPAPQHNPCCVSGVK